MIINAENITKTYTNSPGQIKTLVLENLNLKVSEGEKIAIMGPSGSGKTSLLNLIASFDTVDSGKIFIKDKEMSKMTQNEILEYRNKTIGFVFQFHHLLPQCNLLENVLLPTLPNKSDKTEINKRAVDLLKYMGIMEQRNKMPSELSGGESQRAAVARALINNPKILIADEPTGSLDKENAESLMKLLIDINKKMNITLIIASHSTEITKKMDTIYHIIGKNLEVLV